MPTFCRHGRLAENCSICSRASRTRPGTVAGREEARRADTPARAPREPRAASSSRPRRTGARAASAVKVRRVARAVEDGYVSELVPGLRASEDAHRLADEIAAAVARLETLAVDPPGIFAEAALADDREEAMWLLFVAAALGPLTPVRVSWASGEPLPLDDAPAAPRGADHRRLAEAVAKYRGRALGAGGQVALLTGEASLTPQRRFDRAFERLSLPGFGRSPRYELLVTAGRLGLVDAEPWSLQLGAAEALDPTLVAAKRVFGIGDAINIGRRAGELAGAAGVPIAALDLALFNWGRVEGRDAGGVDAPPTDELRLRVADALGVA